MSSFTCITCHAAFADANVQRSHYKTDWHRYNLKRKVAELPPVTAEEFQRRVLLQRSNNEEQNQNRVVYCNVCRKMFGSPNAFQNHLNSKKHKDNEKNVTDKNEENIQDEKQNHAPEKITSNNAETDTEEEEVDSDEWDEDVENPIHNNNCLFCSHHSKSLVKCMKHMSEEHSFFVPDIEYCINVRGLLEYLGEKIMKGYTCLWCNEKGRTFHSAQAAQQHMIDKGHCKMIHEGIALAEYADFFDYSSSYPDAGNDVDKDEEIEVPEIDGSDYQLVLPSGVTIGHRSLVRYYKQRINPNHALVVSSNNRKLHKVMAHYRALGWTATQEEIAARKARDLRYMKQMESKWRLKMGVKTNKLQKHFRAQVNV